MTCRAFRPPACRERLSVPDHSLQPKSPGQRGEDLTDWIKERRELRRSLDRLGDLDGWLHRKPILTELENMVLDRSEAMRKNPGLPQVLSDTANIHLTTELPRPSQSVVENVSRHLHNDLSKQLKKQEETDPTASIGSNTIEEDEEIQKNIQREHSGGGLQDEEVLVSETLNSCLSTLGGPMGRAVERFREQGLREYLESLEQFQKHKLPITQATLQRGFLHPEDVSVCRSLTLRQAGSSILPAFGGRLKGSLSCRNLSPEGQEEEDKEEEEDSAPHKVHKEMSRSYPFSRRADPNAFWPGHDGHVRLYHPVTSHRSESVLFQLIEYTPALSPGHWPINQAGYSTSGDINRHKVYTL